MSDHSIFPKIPKHSQVGPFKILEVLSTEGHMSRTFIAENQQRKKVVLKIARGDDNKFVNFLKEEVVQLTKLRHPNISHIYPIHVSARQVVHIGRSSALEQYFNGVAPYYYAMELLEGKSLQQNLKTVMSFPIEWRIELIYQLGIVVHHLHINNIAHLDLKPDNIVFRTSPNKNTRPDPVLVDFGTASRHNNRTFMQAGTLLYMSPDRIENITGQKASYRTSLADTINYLPADVWSLGVIAYELLSNRNPFCPSPNTPDEEIINNILHMPISPIPHLSQEINDILLGYPTNNHHRDTEGGMLSHVREQRILIGNFVNLIDCQKQYQPPRY